MINTNEHIRKLCQLYVANTASDEQVKELLAFMEDASHDQLIQEELFQVIYAAKHDYIEDKTPHDLSLSWKNMLANSPALRDKWQQQIGSPYQQELLLKEEEQHVHKLPFLKKWAWVAASVSLLVGFGTYMWMSNQNSTAITGLAETITLLEPGRDGAILQLADGRKVVLDSLQDGLIVSQNGAEAILNNGRLSYEVTGKATEKIEYNTITTPNGRQFTVTLPDGTNVWLNAASSIHYPTNFNGQERRVMVTGEVYMEVAANKSKPFFVNVHDLEVQVLGTSFNINAYRDDPAIKTTLLEGSIKVFKKLHPETSVIVKPQQQVIYDEHLTISKEVDMEAVLAWKNGVFNFNGATIEAFMRQIARWYDLKIEYKGTMPNKTFKGELGRDLELSQVMKLLKQFNLKYQQSGNTIIIEAQ